MSKKPTLYFNEAEDTNWSNTILGVDHLHKKITAVTDNIYSSL